MNSPLTSLKTYLDEIVNRYECKEFIANDPVSIPHGFDDASDRSAARGAPQISNVMKDSPARANHAIEFGVERARIEPSAEAYRRLLNNLADLCDRMRYQPADFIFHFDEYRDASRFSGFVHRTFNESDAVWLSKALRDVLRAFGSIEKLSASFLTPGAPTIEHALQGLGDTLLSIVPEMPTRMRKHLARPSTGSACKRLNLYFRWMVRPGPVDLGIWTAIQPRQLILPLDVHSGRQARRVGLLRRKSNDWKAAVELTQACRVMNPSDPVRYDFAFFGTGAAGELLDDQYGLPSRNSR